MFISVKFPRKNSYVYFTKITFVHGTGQTQLVFFKNIRLNSDENPTKMDDVLQRYACLASWTRHQSCPFPPSVCLRHFTG